MVQSYGYGRNTDWPSVLGGHSTEELFLMYEGRMLAPLPRPEARTMRKKEVK